MEEIAHPQARLPTRAENQGAVGDLVYLFTAPELASRRSEIFLAEIERRIEDIRSRKSIEVTELESLSTNPQAEQVKSGQEKTAPQPAPTQLPQGGRTGDEIDWKGTKTQLLYLFELLIKKDLLPKTLEQELPSTIVRHFTHKGETLTSPGLRNLKYQSGNAKSVRGGGVIREIVSQVKQQED